MSVPNFAPRHPAVIDYRSVRARLRLGAICAALFSILGNGGTCQADTQADRGVTIWVKKADRRRSFTWSGRTNSTGEAHGAGTLVFYWNGKRVATYEGTMENGRMSGRVSAVYDLTGKSYEGEIRDWEENGQGTMTLANGQRQTGRWSEGVLVEAGASPPPPAANPSPTEKPDATAPSNPAATAQREEIRALLKAQRWEQAARACQAYIRSWPDENYGYLRFVRAKMKLGDERSAREVTDECLRRNLAFDDDKVELLMYKIDALHKAERHQEAMRQAAYLALNRPDFWTVTDAVLLAYGEAGAYREGIALLEQVQEKVPTLSHPSRGLAELATMMNDRSSARRYLQRAFALEANVPENYIALGDYHWQPYIHGGPNMQSAIPSAGRAVGAYQKALALMPKEHVIRARKVQERINAITEQFQMSLLFKFMQDPLSF